MTGNASTWNAVGKASESRGKKVNTGTVAVRNTSVSSASTSM
jgi:hypothetical protein